MAPNTTKPWSQLDDELDELTGEITESEPAISSEESPAAVDVGGLVSSVGAPRRARWSMPPHAAIVPMVFAGAWIIYEMTQAGEREKGLPILQALGMLALILGSISMLVFSRFARRAALADLNAAIQKNMRRRVTDSQTMEVGTEFRPVWEALERHLGNVEQRVSEVLEERKQLSLEIGLIDAQRRQAEAIIASIADPVLVTDSFDQIVLANPAAADLFGFSCEDALRCPVDQVIQDSTIVQMIRETCSADVRAAKRQFDHEMGPRVYALTLSPLETRREESGSDASGRHGVVLTMRDVTKARQAAKAKSDFVSHVSHELRTPLSSIRAYVEMLVDGEAADEETRNEYYNIIETSADRLGRMIDNLLNISRIEAGTVRIKKEPVSIAMIVKEATDMMRPPAEDKGIALTEDLTPVVYRIDADRDMVYQSVMNLLSNAVKYTPSGGKVHVKMTADEKNHCMRIEVTDTGVGIPEEDLPHMFEKFFRVEANKKMAKGTGLGLNLVKHIVETVHGGQMTLTSEVGKGSTFGMVLPLLD